MAEDGDNLAAPKVKGKLRRRRGKRRIGSMTQYKPAELAQSSCSVSWWRFRLGKAES